MKLSLKNIVKSKAVLTSVLIVEMLFPFYSVFASITAKDCGHADRVTKKHCCCCQMADEQKESTSCDLNFNMQSSHSLGRCDCVHKSASSSNPVTQQKNFELSKEISVNYFVDMFKPVTQSFSLQNIFSLDKFHSPPIYLITSSIII